jgi:dipeptidyl aminopeptidase/acylaminoacyl peptidase
VGLAAAALAGALPWFIVRPPAAPSFQQLTFHRGRIGGARFAGEAIVFSQAQGLEAPAVSLKLASSPEAKGLGYTAADVLAACSGDLALSVRRRFVKGERRVGTLAVAPIGGGTPHEILENVEDADCDPKGSDFVVARSKGFGAHSELECPIDRVTYRAAGSLHSPRLSRDRRQVAFLEDPAGLGTGGHVVIVDREGKVVRRTREWADARGLAWSPDGREVWFTASETRSNRSLRALRLDGRERLVFQGTGSLTIWDAAPDGRVLLTREDERAAVVGLPPSATAERDLSWFDNAGLASLSQDGRVILFGDRFGIYLRRTDGSPASKLGSLQGYPDDLSPDGSLLLGTNLTASGLFLAPTGPGRVEEVAVPGLESFQGSLWFPDGRRLLVNGREPGHRLRCYVVELPGGRPRPVTDEDTWGIAISPDGALVAAIGQDGPISIWSVDGGSSRPLPGSSPGDRPASWSADGKSLWVFRRGEVPARIFSVEVATGRRTLWKTLVPPDAAGVCSIDELKVTPSGNAYFYSYRRTLSELYEARGLR